MPFIAAAEISSDAMNAARRADASAAGVAGAAVAGGLAGLVAGAIAAPFIVTGGAVFGVAKVVEGIVRTGPTL